ncbi:MAG: beta-ketoacyl-ACP synthase II [Sedimentisphaerales bacterium]|nr:beta-ketoacyl-ACP synthase II [Sedimentisphaerales bacterium]
MTDRRVAITGMGLVTALGESIDVFWENIVAGKNGIKTIESFDTSKYPVHIGGEIMDFDPGNYIDKREAKRIDRFALFALASAISAVKNSGLDMDSVDLDRAGVIIGSGIGGLGEIEKEHTKLINRGPDRVSPFCVPKLMVNAASANVSIYFKLRGVNTSVVTACASGAHAIADAYNHIKNGTNDIVITGASEAALTGLGLASFCALKALSQRNDDPAHASRPFDRDRDGFVLSEGAGVLVLEDYEHAKKRGAHIHAELLGCGMTGDGSHITAPDPLGRGSSEAMRSAVRNAGLELSQIDYINAHGTSTQLNDISETKAIKSVFGGYNDKFAVSSTKSHLGHLLGASGAVELIITSLALEHGIIPPTINLENPDVECDLDYTPKKARPAELKYAISNSFGFGGHNACLVVGKV